jgi:hypothetical protein
VGGHQPGTRIDPRLMRAGRAADAHEGRCQDPPLQELLQHEGAERLAGLPLAVPRHVHEVAVAAAQLEMRAQPGAGDDLLDAAAQLTPDPLELVCGPFALVGVDHGHHGGQRPRLRARGLRQEKDAVYIVNETAEAHDLPPAGQR